MAENRDLWVFAYGSLMWRPGFAFAEVAHARLVGWRRSFCIYSRYHRGSERAPRPRARPRPRRPMRGLGVPRAAPPTCRDVLRYLREREQIISVYREALVPVTLMTPERPEVMALAFLVERAHPSYAGPAPARRAGRSHPRCAKGARAATSIISSARLPT